MQEKSSTVRKTIKIPIYVGKLIITITDDIEKQARIAGFFDFKPSLAFVYNIFDKVYVVLDRKAISNAIVAHETVHIVNKVFQYNGVQLDLENDEPQAYLTSYIFEQIEKVIKYDSKRKSKGIG